MSGSIYFTVRSDTKRGKKRHVGRVLPSGAYSCGIHLHTFTSAACVDAVHARITGGQHFDLWLPNAEREPSVGGALSPKQDWGLKHDALLLDVGPLLCSKSRALLGDTRSTLYTGNFLQ